MRATALAAVVIVGWALSGTAPLARAQTGPGAPAAAAGQPAQAVRPAPKPDHATPPESCATADCHGKVKSYKAVHGPVNVNGCDACHKLADPKAHRFELTRAKTELCTFCHQLDLKKIPVVHKPVSEGNCLGCHNPHGGTTNRFLRADTLGQLCNTCHQDPTADKRMIHGPVAGGACDSCHSAHGSKFPKLLAAEGRDLCNTCHGDMAAQLAQAKFVHKPVQGNCGDCHDPHASNFTMQLKQEPAQLCSSCHEKQKKLAMDAKYKHSAVTTGAACLNCHTAHGGNLASLMKKEPIQLCLNCHDKPQDAEGRTVASMSDVLKPGLIKHGPIRDGNCSGCHQAHGSENMRLLAKPYSDKFYQPFSLDKYELCFSCHDKQLVLTKDAQGLTGFRNGDENLHFVHVNREKGRNCRACHSTHVSANERHIRDSVPFGNWQMPLNYKKSTTGGGCAPGCHKQLTYDRDNPVVYAPAEAAADSGAGTGGQSVAPGSASP